MVPNSTKHLLIKYTLLDRRASLSIGRINLQILSEGRDTYNCVILLFLSIFLSTNSILLLLLVVRSALTPSFKKRSAKGVNLNQKS